MPLRLRSHSARLLAVALLAFLTLSPAPPRPRCPPASRKARPSKASPSTRSPTACACCCSPTRPSRRPRSTSPISSARATRATARPAWRTCSSTCCSRARRRSPTSVQELGRARDALQRLDLLRPHQLLRDLHRDRREPRLGARAGSRPDGESFVAKKDLDTEMTVVRNEFEIGENNPQRVLWGAHAGDRVRLAQLRQPDDRRALRHRERRSSGCRRSTSRTTSPTTRC